MPIRKWELAWMATSALTPRERLRLYRLSQKLTLAKMGARIGCAASSLSMIEQGSRNPGRKTSLVIERVVGIEAREWPDQAGAA